MVSAVLVFAHPVDEAIALGARLARFGNALLVHITDGAPTRSADYVAHGFQSLADYRRARWQELEIALQLAGVGGMRRERLDIPDQEASLQLAGLTRRLAEILRATRPQVVFTHPFEGGHPDHDACAFAVHHAAELLRAQSAPIPLLIEAPFYHAGPVGIETGTFLPSEQAAEERIYSLSQAEQDHKKSLLDCFASQRETLAYFSTTEERYRVAPTYNFRRPAHPGSVFYDSHSWGMTSQGFCELAIEAEEALQEEMKSACC